ncbi:AAA family ATPase [Arthrobacter bambusae]|uniref:ATP-dependent Clp protease ATP-binding subunit ClpA n=1 Tax=Arthrobacter bambusae TaxID=1338426 RepID=A0AAW8DCP3_9MICC|nr:AAA family ATPase [Arthrobacter bambusae]MDP9903196.1 ATP-dependent Clp protease ATP-binding subunit ClpA [Arthrobacter bambusae]MDQ0128810.1 ATP-dependent Clp protease ATP-binding subunit ClpA [Arthrobacter bambusae]MDQ0180151.1 ATP-dependent Clp protease ATP-binding subunit ClpA [Arthrobacter bambusae]
MFADHGLNQAYPTLSSFSAPLAVPDRPIIGREREIIQVMAALERPVLSNVVLLAEAGVGKSALVQAVALSDEQRDYVEVDLAKMISGLASPDEMAALIKALFDEAELYSSQQKRELVLFIDEFHQVVQLSAAAVEALKPVLAASGVRGLKVIAATTFDEFHQHIRPNQPLVERLQRINLTPPDKATTVKILAGMAKQYGVDKQFFDESMFETIHELTERYMPASVQPRKSILVLDSMVGWHRHTGRPMDMHLLADVLEESAGVNVAFNVDAQRIKDDLDSKVLAQDFATRVVAKRLQLCVADLHDKGRPISSFLLTGSSGVGKSTTSNAEIPVWSEGGSVAWKKAGDLLPGDYTFRRDGAPQKVLGVFPQGEREVYRVTLGDGRTLDVSDNHLWAVVPAKRSRDEGYTIYSTQTLINKGLASNHKGDCTAMKYFIPMNEAVQWPERELPVHPYVIGALLGNGHMTSANALVMSSDDEFTVAKVAGLIGAAGFKKAKSAYSWVFETGIPWGSQGKRKNIQLRDSLADVSEMIDHLAGEKRIPEDYMTASIEQRWELVQGLFDTDGCIGQADGARFNVSYSTASEGLALDVQQLLFSLGVASSVRTNRRKQGDHVRIEYRVHVKSKNDGKARFFSLPRKLEIAERALGVNKRREKTFDYVGIRSIEKLGCSQEMVCIYVDDDEHLYQAGQFVVTHNTELTKQLARLLFGDDQRHLLRWDMSEFALPESVELFRSELTQRVWSMGHSVILFDEIEKAASTVTRVLLQVLDDGRLSDDNGRQVSFLNSYIVLTTNAASEIYQSIAQYSPDDDGSGKEMVKRMREIRRSISATQGDNRFPPELLGRIDAIVPFQPLSMETRRRITQNKLRDLRDEVRRKHRVMVGFESRVLDYLVEDKADNDSNAGGARAAIALLADEVTSAIAAYINAHPEERRIRVQVNGELRSENKQLLDSEAYIEVVAVR